jgi:hypothetical protein
MPVDGTRAFHLRALSEQLKRLTGLVGELKGEKAESKRVETVKEMDVALFAACGHLRDIER